MTTTASSDNFFGLGLLNEGDFYQPSSILHPVAIGSIAIIVLFCFLRISSNRTVAPLTIWDTIVNIALGSTLAGIINGQSLVKGVIALTMLIAWQFLTSFIGAAFPNTVGIWVTKPPLVIAFRGRLLEGTMKKHRITTTDLYTAMRVKGVHNICEIECLVVEPTGAFTIYKTADLPKDYEPEVLLSIKGYRQLVDNDNEEKQRQRNTGRRSDGSSVTERETEEREVKPKREEDEKTKAQKDKIAQECA